MTDPHDELDHVLLDVGDSGRVAVVRLNRPQKLNALDDAMMQGLCERLEEVDADPTLRVAIVTGDTRAFAAGADLDEMEASSAIDKLVSRRAEQWGRIERFRKPLIAAVSGWCIGGGVELALAADILFASESAQFGLPEVRLGVITAAGGTQRLVRAIGKSRATELVLTGRRMDAREAAERGLAARVTTDDELLPAALEVAERIAANAPLAVQFALEDIAAAYDMPLSAALNHERRLSYLLFGSDDKREGIAAFRDKRRPDFRAR